MVDLQPAGISRHEQEQPVPIADALAALHAADSLHERRDRVVECFRAVLRYASAVTLAIRVQFGATDAEPGALPELLRGLRQRGLTDGQWVGLMRGLVSAHANQPDAYPLPALAEMFRGKQKKAITQLIDGLLEMRKAETVAHGATGSRDAIRAVLARREPQLEGLLAAFAPVWAQGELAVPLATPSSADERQLAWRLMGYTPRAGQWPRIALAEGVRLEPGEPVLVDAAGRPRVSLAPIALFRRPSPEALEELFVLDGAKRNAAVFVAFPSMAEHREKDVWGHLGEALLGEGGAEEAPPSSQGVGRPFRGLSSFGPEHAALFFGRERQAEALANRIRRHPMITVTGPSGSGKSSLLGAGVFPLLDDALVVSLRPGAFPIAALERRLSPVLRDWERGPELGEVLRERPETLGSYLEAFAREREVLLVIEIDQAEEVFTLCTDDDERLAFALALASAGMDPHGTLRVVIALREDFFARLSTLAPLAGLYTRQVEVVTTPQREDLIKIIFVPLSMFGFSLEAPDLAEAMLESVAGEPAALAMLQFCLDQLWERRDRKWKRLTWDAYRALGGVEGALAAHAEGVLTSMTNTERQLARAVFLRLVTEDGTRAVRSRAEVVTGNQDAAHVVDKLIEARLLTSREGEGDGELVELVHEALLRHWDRLREWLADDEAFVRTRARVAKAADRWEKEAYPADLLLGEGKPLVEARELLARRGELAAHELAFIAASEARSVRSTRIKRLAVMSLAVLAVVAGGFGAYAWQQRGQAREMAVVATENANTANTRLVELLEEQGRVELIAGNDLGALVFLTEALKRGGDDAALHAMIAAAARPADAQRLAFDAHGVWSVSELAFDPRGALLVSGDPTGRLCLWEADDGRKRQCWAAHGNTVRALRFTPDGQHIVSWTGTEPVKLWDLQGAAAGELRGATQVTLVHFDRPRQRIITIAQDGKLRTYGLSGGEPQLVVDSGHEHLGDGSVSADGRWLAAHAFGKTREGIEMPAPSGRALVWDVAALDAPPMVLAGHPGRLDSVGFSPSGELLATGANDGAVVWRVADGSEVVRLAAPRLRHLSFDPTGGHVVTAGYDNVTRIFNATSGKLERTLAGHQDFATPGEFTPAAVSKALFVANGEVLVTRGSDAVLTLHDPAGGTTMANLRGHHFGVRTVVARPGSDELASGGDDGRIILWNVARRPAQRHVGPHLTRVKSESRVKTLLAGEASGNMVVALETGATWFHGDETRDLEGAPLALSGDGARVLLQRGEQLVAQSFDGATTKPVAAPADIAVVRFVPSQPQLVAIGTGVGAIYLVDLDAATTRVLVPASSDSPAVARVFDLAFSPDGVHLAAARRGRVKVVAVATGKEVFETREPSDGVSLFPTCSFDPAGTKLLVATSPLALEIYTMPAGEKAYEVHGDRGRFSPDGQRLAAAEASTPTVWVHDATSGALVLTLDGHRAGVEDLQFSPDGAQLFTASRDGTVRSWETRLGRNIGVLRVESHAGVGKLHVDASGSELLTFSEGAVRVWGVGGDTRSADALAALTLSASPFRLEGVRLVPQITPEQALARASARVAEEAEENRNKR